MIKNTISNEEDYRFFADLQRERMRMLWDENLDAEEDYRALSKRNEKDVEQLRRTFSLGLRP